MTDADGNPTTSAAADPVAMILVVGGGRGDDDKKAVLLLVEKDSTTVIMGDLRMIVQPISNRIRRSIIELSIFQFALNGDGSVGDQKSPLPAVQTRMRPMPKSTTHARMPYRLFFLSSNTRRVFSPSRA
jgi:hypothetical protein